MTVGMGKYMNPRHGDVVRITLDVTDGHVAMRDWSWSGCSTLGPVVGELVASVNGRSREEASRLEARELIERLVLSPDDERCALTVVAAFRAALVDAHVKELA